MTIYEKAARLEARLAYMDAGEERSLLLNYDAAKENGDAIAASDLARAIRDIRLAKTDALLLPDRDVPNLDAWEQYRQELRDLPQRDGFPLETEFPTPPEEG